MSKYLVLRDCYGYKNRYWTQGSIVEIQDSPDIPEHFEKIRDKESTSVVADETELDTSPKPIAKNKRNRVAK